MCLVLVAYCLVWFGDWFVCVFEFVICFLLGFRLCLFWCYLLFGNDSGSVLLFSFGKLLFIWLVLWLWVFEVDCWSLFIVFDLGWLFGVLLCSFNSVVCVFIVWFSELLCLIIVWFYLLLLVVFLFDSVCFSCVLIWLFIVTLECCLGCLEYLVVCALVWAVCVDLCLLIAWGLFA